MLGNLQHAGPSAGVHALLLDGQPESLLDALLAGQRRDWIAGKRIAASEVLRQYPELADAPECAAELIYHEFALRHELGESPDWQQQLRQYPDHADLLERLREADQLVEDTFTAPEPWPARTFGDYELLEEVGRGGMGVVFKARHKLLDRVVALKLLQSHWTGEERKRFDREAQVVALLQHPNIVQIYDVGETDGQAFAVLEFIDGQSLASRLNGTPLPLAEAAALVETLARAVQYGHEKGVIHRDLKPSNIMMRPKDRAVEPVIVDFGLAWPVEPGSARLTASGLIIGTWQYMTPEQLCGERDALGPGCDIYALGVILYELLTGRLPFDAPGQVVRGNPAPPSSFGADVDPRLEAICLKAMAASPDARYATMSALASALTDYLHSRSASAGPGTLAPNRSRQLLVTGVACALITVAIGLWARGVLHARPEKNVTVTARGGEALHEPIPPPANPRDVVHLRPRPLDCAGPGGVSADDIRQAQKAWAKYLGRDVEETVEIASGVAMTFVLVPPGKFFMGSPSDELGKNGRYPDEFLHIVTLTEPFDLGKYEVTQAQFAALTGKLPSYFKGANRPVEHVTWDDADSFGRDLTKKLSDKHVYRLATEAEWEYACRGGRPSSEPFGIGDGRSLLWRDANFDNTLGRTSEVGSYAASALGLHDMHGNLWEWCADWREPYPDGAVTNPLCIVGGPYRVARGGCYNEPAAECRSALRQGSPPERRDTCVGFRLARSVPQAGVADKR